MKTILSGLALSALLLLACCSHSDDSLPPNNDHYILSYDDPQQMKARVWVYDPRETTSHNDQSFYIDLVSPVHLPGSNSDNVIMEHTNPGRYLELANRFNDMARPNHWQESLLFVMFVPTESVNVTSNTDFDASHPAGTPLNEYWQIKYFCADRFLALGGEYDSRQEPNSPEKNLFAEPLPAFNAKQMTLIPLSFHFSLTQRPERSGVHQFTFTYRNVEGKVLTATTEPIAVAGRD